MIDLFKKERVAGEGLSARSFGRACKPSPDRPRSFLKTSDIWKSLSSLIFLNRCLGCDAWLEESYGGSVCADCFSKLHFLKTPAHLPHLSKIYFDKAHSALAYEGVVLDWVHHYKYHRKLYWAPVLSGFLTSFNLDWQTYDAVTFVPLHWRRRFSRGFNPSHLLAHRLAKQKGFLLVDLLKRVRATVSQTKLSSEERTKNVQGAFKKIAHKNFSVKEKSLLLIDDVLTTGATVNECAKVLKKGGAKKVDVLTLARPL
ncbi:MAG: ComF family protein [Deltaproteobacteria bacterium]|nr:ComF family protein [Deltaproteobacteria bacterium]